MQTELAAVNSLLVAIGESPQSSLNPDNIDVTIALEAINTASVDFQSSGWWFNTEVWPMNLDVDGKQVLPSDALYVNTSNTSWVKRGNYLYDSDNQTFIFEEDVSDKTITIIRLLPLTEIPNIVYNYIVNLGKIQILNELESEFNKVQVIQAIMNYQLASIKKLQLKFDSPNALSSPITAKLLRNIRLP